MDKNLPKIAISMGDMNGIGLEVVMKSLQHPGIYKQCVPIIYGNAKIFAYHKNIVDCDELYFKSISAVEEARSGKINVLNVWKEKVNIDLGKATVDSGKYAFRALEAAVKDLSAGKVDALCTAPINKEAMQMAGFEHIGHTEYLSRESETEHSLMMMVGEALKIGLVSAHIPISKVADAVTPESVQIKLDILIETMKRDFGKEKPLIAVLGLNPHAGDNGHIGKEDKKILRPLIVKMKEKGEMVLGPFGADGFFGSAEYKKYDAVLAMYHDQGLIPFKTLCFGKGVNYSAGLSFIRTSPDHGTAYGIAGENKADQHSFLQALFRALEISKTQRRYDEAHANPLKKSSR